MRFILCRSAVVLIPDSPLASNDSSVVINDSAIAINRSPIAVIDASIEEINSSREDQPCQDSILSDQETSVLSPKIDRSPFTSHDNSVACTQGFDEAHADMGTSLTSLQDGRARFDASEDGMMPEEDDAPHAPVAVSMDTSYGASFVEVIDQACSPISAVTPRKDLRRSAAGLIYGVTQSRDTSTNNSSGVARVSFVEVGDMACSPMHLSDDNSTSTKYPTPNSSKNSKALLWNAATESPNSVNSNQMNNRTRDVQDERPVGRLFSGLDSSLDRTHSPTDETHKKTSFAWSATRTAEESSGMHGSQFAGSESLFSTSAVTDENKTNSHLAQSLPTQPVPDGLDSFSEQSESACSYIPHSDAQQADTVLIDRTVDFDSSHHHVKENHSFNHTAELHSSLISDHDAEESQASENLSAHRSLKIMESDSDHDSYDDNVMTDDDDCSVSSNELNMISVLSGRRLSMSDATNEFTDHDMNDFLPVASNIVSDEDDSCNAESDDEMLKRSRKSLRKSILNRPKSSPKSPSLNESSPEQTASKCSDVGRSRGWASDAQEADTVHMSEPESQPPLVVWDKPFYKRTPGKRSKYSLDSLDKMQMADTVAVLNESDEWPLVQTNTNDNQGTRIKLLSS